jgi:phage gp16-like protein
MASTRNQLLARLHCIKRDQGWDDDEYRDILESRTGKRSAADLPERTLARLVASLTAPVARGGAQRHEWSWVDSAPRGKRPLLRKLIMLAKGAGIARGGQVAYIEGIARQMSGTSASAGPVAKPLPMCDEGELWRIVQALAVQAKRRGVDPNNA